MNSSSFSFFFLPLLLCAVKCVCVKGMTRWVHSGYFENVNEIRSFFFFPPPAAEVAASY